ncbi:MAG: alpha-D-ribose 1-methylphosphonate 5-triphosphate diphosphatase, partial [Rhizobiales bacterium]|nr:alpha-D-ribose 1-methylphosphonate 5-triphosphate diphosphatase [Hyphomicrobiales bacterium]
MSNDPTAHHLHFDCALLPDGRTAELDMAVVDGVIAEIAVGRTRDPAGIVALPGMVDLHGDAIEHPLMPRPGVGMPVDVALYDTDRRLAGNGITTALHGLTCSWEPGLRSVATIDAILEGLERLGDGLWVDHRVHLRFESHALDAVEDARRWLAADRIDLVSINRHFPGLFAKVADAGEATPLAQRSGLAVGDYRALMAAIARREAEAETAVARVLAAAAEHGVAAASHDDRTAEDRLRHRAHGATIVDFPLALPAAEAARVAGEPVIMGAPNVLRGGSHNGKGVPAAELVLSGHCTILAADYFYPAMPAAAVRLWRAHGLELGAA